MTISEETITRAVARYQREYDRYLKLCARVAEICRLEIVEGNAMRAQVTSRAKSPKSLEGKLRRFAASGKKEMPDEDAVFSQIRDLAAVRIATYEAKHEDTAVEQVKKRFAGPQGQPPVSERKDKHATDQKNFYRATHCEVFLPSSDLVGTYANVRDVPCEIQVCSMMAHVWNEIEHDLGYKPLSGELSSQEQELLVNLGHAIRSSDGMITQLLAATDRRQAEQTDAFSDVYDFVSRVRGWFPGVDFGRHSGALFEALRPIRLLTLDSIRKVVDLRPPINRGAETRLLELSEALVLRGDTRFELDADSSDLLLVAMLPRIARYLTSSQSPTTSTEGTTRVRWLAERYLDLQQGKSDA